jgi:hypothetical protein
MPLGFGPLQALSFVIENEDPSRLGYPGVAGLRKRVEQNCIAGELMATALTTLHSR